MKFSDDKTLNELLAKAFAAYEAMTPWQKIQHREKQRISFVYGNLAMSTHHRASLENVRRAALELWLDDLVSRDRSRYRAAVHKLADRLGVLGVVGTQWLFDG